MSPTIFREEGYRFYSLENEKNRMHIPVTCEDGEAKFWAASHGLNPTKAPSKRFQPTAQTMRCAAHWRSLGGDSTSQREVGDEH